MAPLLSRVTGFEVFVAFEGLGTRRGGGAFVRFAVGGTGGGFARVGNGARGGRGRADGGGRAGGALLVRRSSMVSGSPMELRWLNNSPITRTLTHL